MERIAGREDARLVRFADDDGSTLFATYTAYSGFGYFRSSQSTMEVRLKVRTLMGGGPEIRAGFVQAQDSWKIR
jgi:hypothetical protein